MAEGSKAKFIREALERAVDLKVPQVSPEEFQRMFNVVATREEIQTLTLGELMIRQMVLKACTGNDRSITETLDRLLGKPMQTTESVSKSYSYHDLLVEMKTLDAAEGKVLDVPSFPSRRQAIAYDAAADLI